MLFFIQKRFSVLSHLGRGTDRVLSFLGLSYTFNFMGGRRHKGACFTPAPALAPCPIYLHRWSKSLAFWISILLHRLWGEYPPLL